MWELVYLYYESIIKIYAKIIMYELKLYNYKQQIINKKNYSEEKKKYYLNQIKILEKNKLTIILNSYHFSNIVGIKWRLLKKIIAKPENFYYNFEISKKSGGKRKINVPNNKLELCQRFIKNNILDCITISNYCHGFATNRSIVTNAKQHLNKKVVLNIDLKDFFPSIQREKVFYVFNKICGYDSNLSHCFTQIVMYNGGLPQGACTSPILSNIISYKMDLRLSGLANKKGISYSRYADDITFSGNNEEINDGFLKLVKKIVNECGFTINDKKTRFQRKGNHQEVTGLIVNNSKVAVSKKYLKNIRQELYYIKKYGVESHMNHEGIYNAFYKEHIKGKIMFVYSIDKEIGKSLLKIYNEIFIN